MKKLLDDIIESMRWTTQRDNVVDPIYDPLAENACRGVGYGALMDAASRMWRKSGTHPIPGGEFVVGPCRATVDRWLREYDLIDSRAAQVMEIRQIAGPLFAVRERDGLIEILHGERVVSSASEPNLALRGAFVALERLLVERV